MNNDILTTEEYSIGYHNGFDIGSKLGLIIGMCGGFFFGVLAFAYGFMVV